jgi:hypothetical protein
MLVACPRKQRSMEGEEKMDRRSTARILYGFAVTGAASLAAYALAIRPWHLRWGATNEEIARAMPLDERVRLVLDGLARSRPVRDGAQDAGLNQTSRREE